MTLPSLVYRTKSVYYAASASEGQARLPLSGGLWELFRKNKDFADSLAEAQKSKLLAILIPVWTSFE
jgi:hypothetical protein